MPYVSQIRCGNRDLADIRLPVSSHPTDFRTVQKPLALVHLVYGATPLRPTSIRRPSILLFSSHLPPILPPSLPALSPPRTPMETVASWHGEVNYKRYQSLGVVGRLVGLGSTDSQLPLRADPRARAIAPSPSLSASFPPSPPLFALHLH